MKFALSIKTNKDKSTEIVRTLLLTPLYIHMCACVMMTLKRVSTRFQF